MAYITGILVFLVLTAGLMAATVLLTSTVQGLRCVGLGIWGAVGGLMGGAVGCFMEEITGVRGAVGGVMAGITGVLIGMLGALWTACAIRLERLGPVAEKSKPGDADNTVLRVELASVAGFMGAERVAHATHAIELVEKMEGLLPDLKDEAVRKRTLEEIEALRAEVATFTKEARRCGEEARVAGLLESAATARHGLSGTGRDFG